MKAHDGTRQGQHFVCEGNLDSDFEKFMVAPQISVSTSTCASAVKYLLEYYSENNKSMPASPFGSGLESVI
jgi:hypothetical protein